MPQNTGRPIRSRKLFAAANLSRLLMCVALSIVLGIGVLNIGGCNRDTSEPASDPATTSYRGMTAEQFLQSIFSRYRNAQSYRDRGQVRLSYQTDGQTRSEIAPLSVWLDRNSLYVDAYDAHLRHSPDQLMAWITDPTSNDFDSQVVSTKSQPGRPTIHALLADTVLRERITAGLAGPPPQLDWLFAEKPMERLFDGPYTIRFGKSTVIEDQPCVTVVVQAADDAYRFSIDERSGVIRKVQLPSILAPIRFQNANPSGKSARAVRLTLELAQATFESPKEQTAQAVLPRQPKFVSHFIPLPPDMPSSALDTEVAPLKVVDQSGRVTLTHRGFDCDFTLVLIASDHPADLGSAANLIQWAAVMSPEIRQRVGIAIAINESGFQKLPRDCPVPLFLDSKNEIQNAIDLPVGDLAIINRDAKIVWVQDGVSPDSIVQLGLIIGDLLGGIDVPARLRTQWQSDKTTYQSVLNAEVARHAQR